MARKVVQIKQSAVKPVADDSDFVSSDDVKSNSDDNTKAQQHSKTKNTKRHPMGDMLFGGDTKEDLKEDTPLVVECPTYVVEVAKSGRAECRRCDEKIANKELRVGVITDGDWGLFTRWHHLHCTIFHHSITVQNFEALDGFAELPDEHKDAIKARVISSASEIDEDTIPVDPNELVRKSWCETKEPSDELLVPLLSYQKEGLGWMYKQETSSSNRGGILADEMGMGKTIQAISLLLANKPDKDDKVQREQWDSSEVDHGIAANSLARCSTLIVLPTVAVRQWQMEMTRFTTPGTFKVIVYHGADRETNVEDLQLADVVLTSYKIMEIEYRKATAGTKVMCRICGKKFYADKLRVHRKYFCGDSAERTLGQSKTEKKRSRSASFKQVHSDSDDDSESESESSEDEIDRQKRLIKSMKNGKSAVTLTAKSSKAKPSKPSGRFKATVLSKGKKRIAKSVDTDSGSDYKAQSDEDESDTESDSSLEKQPTKKQKQEVIEKKSSVKGKRVSILSASAASKNPRGKSKSKGKQEEEEEEVEEQEEETEDDIDKQKRLIKSMKDKESPAAAAKKVGKGKQASKGPKKGSQKDKNNKKTIKKRKKGQKDSDISDTSTSEDDSHDDHANAEAKRVTAEVERDIAKALKAASRGAKPSESILHKISWFRIILDEAHMIKDRSSSTCKAVFNLISLYKWCLTGTPLQNRVGELYSLVRFLRVDPHAYYYCKTKNCHCKSLHYRFTQGKCDDCHHSAMMHYCHFNKHILNPIKRSGYVDDGRKAMLKLKSQILDEILLRRTKTDRSEDIQLPPRIVKIRYNHLDEKEDDFYQALYTQSQAQFNTYITAGTVLNNYAHIFDILIRLRQAVVHPYLVIHSNTGNLSASASSARASNNFQAPESSTYCGVCSESIEQQEDSSLYLESDCGHWFCRECIVEYIEETSGGNQATQCPKCNEPLSIDLTESKNQLRQQHSSNFRGSTSSNVTWIKGRKSILDKIDLNNFQTSTKMEALMQELYSMEHVDPGSKAIVFSQFVNMLELLDYRISTGGIRCVKLLGSMNLEQRDKAIKGFKEDPHVKVMLISLKAGGVALNLTVANRIFLMDPWWNPAAEMQAIDRTHRIGQRKPIYATRFIIEDSIEDRILKLQDKKKLVFDGTVGGDASSMARLTVDDMRFLFQ